MDALIDRARTSSEDLPSVQALSDNELMFLITLSYTEATGDWMGDAGLQQFWSELLDVLDRERLLRKRQIRDLERMYFG